VTKSRDIRTLQRSLTFELDFPEAEDGIQPRHRFMSAYEQKVETPDKNYQFLLFACEPYETGASMMHGISLL
jgi:splicing factor 3A subunit 2